MKRNSHSIFSFIGSLLFAGAALLAGCGGGGGGSDSGGGGTLKSGDKVWSIQSMPSTTVINEVRGIAKAGNNVYTVGYDTKPGGNEEWRIEIRTAATGSIVATFVSGATTTLGDAKANAIVTDPTSSSIFVVGYDTYVGNLFEWRIEKRDLTTGLTVSTFGTNGVITSSTGSDAVAYAVATGPTATYDTTPSLYIAGYSTTAGGDLEWRIEKRNIVTGLSVTAFGNNGVVTNSLDTPSPGLEAIAYGIAVGANALYVAGYDTKDVGVRSWRIEMRDLATGASITTIRSLPTNSYGCDAEINGITVDQNSMYVIGYDFNGDCMSANTNSFNYEWLIEKRNLLTGDLVAGFGNGVKGPGVAYTAFPYNPITKVVKDAIPYAISIDATNNNMYVAGYWTYNASFDEQWRIEKRDLTTGDPVTSFGTSGVVLVPANLNLFSEAFAITQDTNYIYTGGFDELVYNVSETWRTDKRLK